MTENFVDAWTQLQVMICFPERAAAICEAVLKQFHQHVSHDILLADDVQVHGVVVVQPQVQEISEILTREIDQLVLSNAQSPSRYLFLGILVDCGEGLATQLASNDEMARLPILFKEISGAGRLDPITELFEALMMSVGAGLAFASENPTFSLTHVDAVTRIRERAQNSPTEKSANSEHPESGPFTVTDRSWPSERERQGGRVQTLLSAAAGIRSRRAVNTARARTKTAIFDKMSTDTTTNCLYVVEVAGRSATRSVRKRQSDLLSLVGEFLAERQDGPWFYSVISSDRTTFRRSGPEPVNKLMLERGRSRAGFDFSLVACAEQLREIIVGDRKALERRGGAMREVYVLFMAVEPPLMTAAAAEAYRALCSSINGCAWLLFGRSDTSIPDDLGTAQSLVLQEHDDIAEQIRQELFGDRSPETTTEDLSMPRPSADPVTEPTLEIPAVDETSPRERVPDQTGSPRTSSRGINRT